jgi:hypothetical protein
MTTRRLLAALAVLALLVAACGQTAETTTTRSPATTASTAAGVTTSTTTAPTTTQPSTTTTAPPTTTEPPTTTTTRAAPSPTTTLPGEPMDFGPRAGDVLGVIGVSHDDVLNVRLAPGIDQPIITTLHPLEDGIVALGNTRSLPRSIWIEVEVSGTTGWVSLAYVAYLGQVSDETSAIVNLLGGIPEAETMLDLGLTVAEALASDDPASRIVMSAAPTVGDLGEVTYDVVGIGDDAVRGFRLHVFGTPSESGEGFILKSVEQTLVCGRGISDGLCV